MDPFEKLSANANEKKILIVLDTDYGNKDIKTLEVTAWARIEN